MCARYNLRLTPSELAAAFDVLRSPEFEPRYNVAPTQMMPILRAEDAVVARWGLIPSWMKQPKTKFPLVNARAETVATTPMFRSAFKRKRCLVPATGFYEWTGPKGSKQPHHIGLAGDAPFAFAGLWERWGEDLESFTIVTCAANELMAPLHDRMPVILERSDWNAWLDPQNDDRESLESLLAPFDANAMREYASNPIVNNVRHETPECLEPAST